MYDEYTRLLSFCSVKQALWAEETLNRFGFRVVLVPKPRQIDANCGQCILFTEDTQDEVLALLQEKCIYWSSFFKREPGHKSYELYARNEEGSIEWEE
ncbi:MAG: DUF3343 domain-containing protein [Veillonellales bacterium]